MNEIQLRRLSGSKNVLSIGVHASNSVDSDIEKEVDHPFRASSMNELRNSAKPFYQNEANLDETMISNEDSKEEDYHMVTGVNRHRQISQNPQ